jgi:hypothetical protein
VTSSGIGSPILSQQTDYGESIQEGTSQAAPVICGVILLLQEYVKRSTGELPTVDHIEQWLRASAVATRDGDDEDDNVINTQETYLRVDALSALQVVQRELTGRLFRGDFVRRR